MDDSTDETSGEHSDESDSSEQNSIESKLGQSDEDKQLSPDKPPDGDEHHSADSNNTSHKRMERYQSFAKQEREYRARKEEALESVGDDLTEAVETALAETGANVEVTATANDGISQTLAARLDSAALIARIMDELPPGFTVKRVNDDGTLTVEWDRREDHSPEQRATAILKAIVSERVETGSDDLIQSVPSYTQVIERATELDVKEELARKRLDRLVELDVIDIEDGYVYPDSNFSQI